MAAEAYNETGNTPEALRLINLVRARSGATEITGGIYLKNSHNFLRL